jgi:hypothetical protein
MRRVSTTAVLVGVLGFLGCSAPTSPTTLTATLTANPNPTTAAASQGVSYTLIGDSTHPDVTKAYPYTTSFVVDIEETGGTALNITAVNLRVQQASGGIVIAPSGGEVEHADEQATCAEGSEMKRIVMSTTSSTPRPVETSSLRRATRALGSKSGTTCRTRGARRSSP